MELTWENHNVVEKKNWLKVNIHTACTTYQNVIVVKIILWIRNCFHFNFSKSKKKRWKVHDIACRSKKMLCVYNSSCKKIAFIWHYVTLFLSSSSCDLLRKIIIMWIKFSALFFFTPYISHSLSRPDSDSKHFMKTKNFCENKLFFVYFFFGRREEKWGLWNTNTTQQCENVAQKSLELKKLVSHLTRKQIKV